MFSFQRKIFVLLLTSIVLVLSSSVFAANQVVSGYVFDNNDHPLPYSIVKKVNTDGYTICDQSGYFYLKNVNRNDSLEIMRYGYQSQTIIKKDFKPGTNLVVKLVPRHIQLQSVSVEAFSPELNSSSEIFSRLGYTQELNNHDNQKVLSYLPGSYLKAYGGEAGTVTLSMNGAPASHTNVSLAGFNINNFQNGTIDFSNIPTDFIRNIVLLSANSTDFRNSGTEGTILLSPWTGENSLTMGAGSFGYQKYSATAHRSFGKINFNLYAGRELSNGDFKYYDAMTDQNSVRKNNDFNQNYISSKINGFVTDNIFIKSLLLYSEQERGIPGSTSFPTPEAFQDDQLTLFANQFGYLYGRGYNSLKTIYKESYSKYDVDPSDSSFSRHKLYSRGISLTNQHKFSEHVSSNLMFKFRSDQVRSTDAGKHTRNTLITDLSAKIEKFITIQPSLKWQYSANNFNRINPGILAKYKFSEVSFLNYFSVKYKKHYYHPTFNDLYWIPGGNPDLEAEKTDNYSAELSFNPYKNHYIKINGFYKSGSDLIQWAPDPEDPDNWMGWFPQNIQEVERSGAIITYDSHFSSIPLNLHLNYIYNNARNKLEDNKQLTYTPKHSGSLILDYTFDKFVLNTSLNYIGERITSYASQFSPQDSKLESMYDLSSRITYNLPLQYFDLGFSASVENILDKNMATIADYPLPGRHYKFSIKLSGI